MTGSASNPSLDIIDTVLGESSFRKLLGALQAAGMIDMLKGAGPYTLFAPTEEAFAKLGPGIIQDWEKPANHQQLRGILKHHIGTGRQSAADLRTRTSLEAMDGSRLSVVADGSGIRVNGARLIGNDIACSNGIIHVVDRVLES